MPPVTDADRTDNPDAVAAPAVAADSHAPVAWHARWAAFVDERETRVGDTRPGPIVGPEVR